MTENQQRLFCATFVQQFVKNLIVANKSAKLKSSQKPVKSSCFKLRQTQINQFFESENPRVGVSIPSQATMFIEETASVDALFAFGVSLVCQKYLLR